MAAILFALAGCGGGGGNSGGGSNNETPQLTIIWPQRSRSLNAPASALSAVITVADASSRVLIFTHDRDATQTGGYTETFSAPSSLAKGQYTVTVQFYSQADGKGSMVGVATQSVDLSKSPDIGDIAVVGTVASVSIAPKQTILVGKSADLTYTAYDSNGAAIASITPGSAFYTVTDGQSFLSLTGGQLLGNSNGLSQVTVTIDGHTSAPQPVGVGNASFVLNCTAPYGPIALNYQVADSTNAVISSTTEPIGFGATYAVNSAWFYTNTATAPAGYGDEVFQSWQRNGQTVSASPTYSFLPGDPSGALPLTAVYVGRSMPTGGFTPNYNKPDNLAWPSGRFPLKIYLGTIADGSVRSRILAGFDRWTQATGQAVSYQTVSDPSAADVTVELGDKQLSPGEGGLTTLTTGSNTVDGVVTPYMSGDISILTSIANQPAQNGVDPLTITAMHEFGHLLGIVSQDGTSGHSDDPNDVMYASLDRTVDHQITERDINTLENRYPGIFGLSGGTRSRARGHK